MPVRLSYVALVLVTAFVWGADPAPPGRCNPTYIEMHFKPLFAEMLRKMGGTSRPEERERLLRQLDDPAKAEEIFRRLDWATRMITPAQGGVVRPWLGLDGEPVKIGGLNNASTTMVSALQRIDALNQSGFLDADLSWGAIIGREGTFQMPLTDVGVRHLNVFWRRGILSVGHLCLYTEAELLNTTRIGEIQVRLIKEKLAEKGLSLAKPRREPITAKDISQMNRAELWDSLPPHLLPLSRSAQEYLSRHRALFPNLRELYRQRNQLIDVVTTFPGIQNEIAAYLDSLAVSQPIP